MSMNSQNTIGPTSEMDAASYNEKLSMISDDALPTSNVEIWLHFSSLCFDLSFSSVHYPII